MLDLMEHGDFQIGVEFWCDDRQWLCTDVGSPVITAIRIYPIELATCRDGITTTQTLSRAEAEALGYFNGPPYSSLESVFDENDFDGCSLEPQHVT